MTNVWAHFKTKK